MNLFVSGISSRFGHVGQGCYEVCKAGLRAGAGIALISVDCCLIADCLIAIHSEKEPMTYYDYRRYRRFEKNFSWQGTKCARLQFTKMINAWKVAGGHFQEAWSPTPPTLYQRVINRFRS